MSRWLRPAILWPVTGVVLALLAFVYFYGGPSGVTYDAAPGTNTAHAGSEADVQDAGAMPFGSGGGVAPEGGVEMPLIPIPGCRCHSDDPQVVADHMQYSLSECWDCHTE